jgi:hypothetical protein
MWLRQPLTWDAARPAHKLATALGAIRVAPSLGLLLLRPTIDAEKAEVVATLACVQREARRSRADAAV